MGVDRELDWVEQARRGDEHAFAQLVAAYQLPVYNLAYRMLGTSAEAEDATQEAFIRVWSKLDTYDPSRKLSSWVLSVASHYCIDRLRRRRGGQVSMEEIMASRWLPADDPKPEDSALMRERDARVRFDATDASDPIPLRRADGFRLHAFTPRHRVGASARAARASREHGPRAARDRAQAEAWHSICAASAARSGPR